MAPDYAEHVSEPAEQPASTDPPARPVGRKLFVGLLIAWALFMAALTVMNFVT